MASVSYLLAEEPGADLDVVQAMVEELEDYLIKDELYRTIIVRTPTGDQKILMTGGDLLTRMRRLTGERSLLTSEQRTRFDVLHEQAEAIIYGLRTRFRQRLLREMKARLDSLGWFLDDCRGDLQRCRTNFPFEMRNRQRIEEILERVGDEVPDELKRRLQEIDHRVRQYAVAAPFIWDKRLESVFPRRPYWYLYMRP